MIQLLQLIFLSLVWVLNCTNHVPISTISTDPAIAIPPGNNLVPGISKNPTCNLNQSHYIIAIDESGSMLSPGVASFNLISLNTLINEILN